MGPFLPLFSVVVEHAFYAAGLCRGLRFAPCAASAALLGRLGCIVRTSGHGLEVHGRALDLPPTTWLAHAGDPVFASATDGLPQERDEVLFFDGERAVHEADGGAWRLHGESVVSRSDLFPVQWPSIASVLSPLDRRVPPSFIVRVPKVTAERDANGRRLCIRFEARSTVWKYCLLGDWSDEPLQVVDLARDTEFGPSEPVPLDNGQAALAIRSSSRIALRERAPQRFQLRTRGGSEKVLVKRLPVAGASQFRRETIAGVSTLVSEIYVYR